MSILNQEQSLLLIIDVQEKLLRAVFDSEQTRKNSEIMSKASDILLIPAVITEQYPKGLGNTIENIKINQNVKIFEKTSFSALDNLEIAKAIETSGRKQIVLFGIETHICVCQTANALINNGYEVYVIENACGSRNEKEHLYGLKRMEKNGVNIITTEIALFEWLKTSQHPKFKEIQALIK